MPFGTDVSNLKLRAPDDEVENYAVAALEQLNREGVVAQVIGDFPNDFNGHLQGIAIRDKHAILTTSAKGGYLIPSKAEVSGLRFATKRSELKQIPNFNHPGGIQTIGSYVAVPVYNGVGRYISIIINRALNQQLVQILRLKKQIEPTVLVLPMSQMKRVNSISSL